MKWYNKDKTKMIDLSSIVGYEIFPSTKIGNTTLKKTLHIVLTGGEMQIEEEQELDELYKMLTSQKEVL
jgi:hypothetical protein